MVCINLFKYQQMESKGFRHKLELADVKIELKVRDRQLVSARKTIEEQTQGLITLRNTVSDILGDDHGF